MSARLPGVTDEGDFSVGAALGGVRGTLESVIPGLVFVIVYVLTFSLKAPLIGSGICGAIALIARLVQRQSIRQALVGLAGVGIGLVWALLTGNPADFFAFGLWLNAIYGGIFLISILVRRPLGTALVCLYRGEKVSGASQRLRRAGAWATWLWVVLFGLRLAVETPLYLSDQVAALGSARLALGLPPYILVAYLSWRLLAPYLKREKPLAH